MILVDEPGLKTCRGCGGEFLRSTFPTYWHNKNNKRYPHSRCAGCYRDYQRAAKRRSYDRRKPYKIEWQYGITMERRDEMLAEQDGCGICHRPDPGARDWHTDHDHACCPGTKSCGKCVRGVLCRGCNTAIGLMNDDALLLVRASTYLEMSHG